MKDAADAAARLQRLEVGTLTIGMVCNARYSLPRLLSEFQREHEGVEIQLGVGNREQRVRWLQGDEIDIATMSRPPTELTTRGNPFAARPHVFVAPTNHPLLKVGRATIESLKPYGFALRERGSGTRAAMEKFLEESRMELRVVMEMGSNETIQQAVMAGLGISFLSLDTIGLELENQLVAVLDVEGTPIVRAWNVVHNLSKPLLPAAEALPPFHAGAWRTP